MRFQLLDPKPLNADEIDNSDQRLLRKVLTLILAGYKIRLQNCIEALGGLAWLGLAPGLVEWAELNGVVPICT